MMPLFTHRWDLTPKEAIALQKELAGRILKRPKLKRYRYVAGVDLSYNRFSPDCFAAVVVWDTAKKQTKETVGVRGKSTFPYIPGLLSFREIPLLMEAFAQLQTPPDVVMVDGQGYAHPRRIGIASHLGLLLDLPSIGCAKSRLLGTFEEPALEAGSATSLIDKGEVIGQVLRTKHRCKSLYISIGHKIDLESAVRVVLETGGGYRVPEPTRQAHLTVNAMRVRARSASKGDPEPPAGSPKR